MLSPHEFATLVLVRQAPDQLDMNRAEVDALLERQLVMHRGRGCRDVQRPGFQPADGPNQLSELRPDQPDGSDADLGDDDKCAGEPRAPQFRLPGNQFLDRRVGDPELDDIGRYLCRHLQRHRRLSMKSAESLQFSLMVDRK